MSRYDSGALLKGCLQVGCGHWGFNQVHAALSCLDNQYLSRGSTFDFGWWMCRFVSSEVEFMLGQSPGQGSRLQLIACPGNQVHVVQSVPLSD